MALIVAAPAVAHAACLPIVCQFSISGKRGRYIEKQVDDAQLVAADAKVSTKLSGGRSLSEQSVNRGAFAGTGLHMRETEAALDSMLGELRMGWTRRAPPPVTFRIVGSTNFNPSARPDNVIVVPLGVLIRATSDDEVAWVLAHEFSHIALAHFSREAEQQRLKSSVGQIVNGLQTMADMSQQRVDASGQGVRIYRVENKDAENFSNKVWARSRDVGVGLELLNQQLSRKQEDQADVAGMDLVLVSRYSDTGAGDALDAVAEDEKRLAASLSSFKQQFSDIAKQSGAKSALKLSNGISFGAVAKELFEDIGRNLTRVLIDRLLDFATTSHRPADARKRGIYSYLNDAYRGLDFPTKRTAWLDRVRGTKEFRDAQIAVEARDSALLKLLEASPEAAQDAWTALQPALQTPYGSTPLIANVRAKIHEALGDLPAADKEYGIAEHPPPPAAAPAPKPPARPAPARGGKGRKTAAKPPPPPAAPPPPPSPPAAPDILYVQSLEGYRDHVALLLRMKSYAKALTIIDEAKDRYGDDDPFLPALITIYTQTKKPNQLVSAISRCLDTEDDALRKQCQYALLSDDQLKQIDEMPPADRARVETAMAKTSDASRRASWWRNLSGAITPKQGD